MSAADRLSEWLPFLWFLLVVGGLMLLWASGLLSELVKRVTKFGGFGLEFEFNEDSAKETRVAIEGQLADVRKTIQRELAADVRARSLQNGLKAVLEASPLGPSDSYRATIHIPDPLYDNWLYQLLDYHPRGAGHGRTFSARAGIIGLAWRMNQIEQWSQNSGITLDMLIMSWGMTHREAAQRRVVDRTKVMLAIPLDDPSEARQVGVLYLDSDVEDTFGETEAQRESLAVDIRSIYRARLAQSLSELVESAMRRSPQLALENP